MDIHSNDVAALAHKRQWVQCIGGVLWHDFCFVLVKALCSSQQFFSHFGMFPWVEPFEPDNVSC